MDDLTKKTILSRNMRFIEPIRSWYGRFERPISSISLVGGFIFDAITLKRVDTLWENLWVFGHILIVGIFIILIHVQEKEEEDEKNPSKAHFWYVNILQFFFGGILSTYLVFYFRSADIFVTWPFIAILVAAFIANESLKRHYTRLSFQISLFFLSIYSFMIFLIPVITHEIGVSSFLLAGVLSLVFIILFILTLFRFIKDKFIENKKFIWVLVGGIFVTVNFLYFTNLIPPIPLSLKDGDVVHTIKRNTDGNYTVEKEKTSWLDYFKLYQNIKTTTFSPVYAYTAIFSPTGLNLTVFHEWEYYNAITKKWTKNATIKLSVVGGRDGGFRTYSMRQNLKTGKWRVNVLTEGGKLIGRLRLNIEQVPIEPFLLTEIKK